MREKWGTPSGVNRRDLAVCFSSDEFQAGPDFIYGAYFPVYKSGFEYAIADDIFVEIAGDGRSLLRPAYPEHAGWSELLLHAGEMLLQIGLFLHKGNREIE